MKANRFRFRVWIKESEMMITDVDDICMPRLYANGDLHIEYDSQNVTKDVILMQSTGLCDKKGKEIFEGDIVHSSFNDCTYVVKFGMYGELDGETGHQGFYIDCDAMSESILGAEDCLDKIGNIYENPDLLT